MGKRDVTQSELASRLAYDPHSGELTWVAKGNSRKVVIGTRAGSISPYGHRVIKLSGYLYPEHHIIWRLHFGKWPDGFIDHINHNEQDNRLANLRDVDSATNNRNQSKRSDNTTGIPGVWISKVNGNKKFIAEVSYDKKRVHRSSHYTLDEAVKARSVVLKKYGFDSNHGIVKPV